MILGVYKKEDRADHSRPCKSFKLTNFWPSFTNTDGGLLVGPRDGPKLAIFCMDPPIMGGGALMVNLPGCATNLRTTHLYVAP